jgi:hypothetical protein
MDLRLIVKAAKEQGWREERTTKGHLRLVPPDPTKRPCVASGTPGDARAIRNFLAQCRRSGLVWPPPGKGQR